MHESCRRPFVSHRMSVGDHLISYRKLQSGIDFPSEIAGSKKSDQSVFKNPPTVVCGFSFGQFLVAIQKRVRNPR